ncbi:MAG: ISL3 family transposase [Actinobacteria bacterium]|nr:ISL3 family transposase [Actinomycetota bacterium]
MRATTAFNRMLQIPGATVATVTFAPEGIVVELRRRFRRLTCPHCGWSTRASYDRTVRRWRHVDAGSAKLWLEAEIRRLSCKRCGKVVTEQVPWARHDARHSRDMQDVTAWLAQRADKESVRRLLRISWEAVRNAVSAVVAEQLDDSRLDNLFRIGVDEISYRKGHRYLTVVADHDRDGAVVWVGEGRDGASGKDAATLARFYEELGEERCRQLQAVSLDLGGAYAKATREHAPDAVQCADPFHVIALANKAIDETRRWAWNLHRQVGTTTTAKWVKRTRWALVKDPASWKAPQREVIAQLKRDRSLLYRAWLLKEALRDLYRLNEPDQAPVLLDRWLGWACRSRIPAFVKLSRTIRAERDRILAAVELGLSNSKLEGLNSKVRLINHRGYGRHTPAALIAMIYLCCGGITVQLPTET